MRLLPTSFRIAIILGCIVLTADAQDPKQARLYLSEVLEPTSKRNAAYFIQPDGKDGELFIGRIYTLDGKLKAEGRFRDEALTVEEGPFVFYHLNGQVESKGLYAMGNKSGVWERFDVMGQPLAEKVYNPEPLANIIYTRAQTMPQVAGGERALVRTIKEKVTDPSGKNVRGSVTASFIVEKNGDLTDVKVVEGKNEAINDQVVDVIKSTAPWTPGEDKGVPVRVQMRLPVQF
ncbi:MAG: TonB family protein [Flavobacteriales bacterium]|nr:TonB family protein [Flavobacteriales bacterium]